ncbi:flagellar basal-body rod protein FlgF [Pelotomaculum propionicicum]|uniref:flagellar basal-body rod protein FlgF n=1 Tax=Pelotomaculum propionicicum TaxID=258475 RepID=UPI003B799356
MLRGLYSSTTGMNVQQAKVDNISNNMANSTTPGYKKDELLIQSFPEQLLIEQGGPKRKDGLPLQNPAAKIGSLGTGSLVAETVTDYTAGTLQETGNPTDIAIRGPGFFVVSASAQEDPDKVYYTRSGFFKVDQEGYLTLNGRYRVLGEAGEIRVGSDKFTVSPDGSIDAGGTVIDRLRLVEFDDLNSLSKEGEGLFTGIQGSEKQAAATTVVQGRVETSNVNVVDEMAQLISVMRAYEANQRIIQNYDEILNKAVNQIGSIR